ncbi:tetratricopeptide repeat protein [Nitrospinae bacterium AH_259_B05_G02_I21]|nr:tetratricopeptide repeat protein [Nitrospinae bacterium AH_259_B05_G02_I21]MDA2932143.1 tetratricopeptide repeat protein [Nitrospinae bacterium AH-259-F20]
MMAPEVPKYFVGRAEEQAEFRERLSDYRNRRVWFIHGIGGIGKSYILQKLQTLCVEDGLPQAYVEFDPSSVSTSIQTLRAIVADLWGDDDGKFCRANEKLTKLETLQRGLMPRVLEGIQAVTTVAGMAANILGSGVGSAAAGAFELARNLTASGMSENDATFYVQAPQLLLKSFKEDFEGFRKLHRRPVVLFFDAYERAESPLDELVRHLVLYLPETFFVIGSRDNIDWKTREDVEPGLRELNFYDTPIDDFIDKDSNAYFDERGVEGEELRERILTLTGGFPQLLALACDVVALAKEQEEEPSPEEFDYEAYEHEQVTQFLFGRFLDRLTGEKEFLRDIVLDLGLCRWANREVLETLFGVEPVTAEGYLKELRKFSFVIQTDRLGKVIRYHGHVRKAVLAWWRGSPRKRETIHRQMHEYHLPGWNERSDINHLRETLYHHVQFEPMQAMSVWFFAFDTALKGPSIPVCEALIGDIEDYSLVKDAVDDYSWGSINNLISIALCLLPTGSRSDNLQRVINLLKNEVLPVWTKDKHPREWAIVQNNLGNVYHLLPIGDLEENLRASIQHHQASLEVRTEESYPEEWAGSMNNLGISYSELFKHGHGDRVQKAIECHKDALRVRTKEDFPFQWAGTMLNLGSALCDLPTDDEGENIREAIECLEAALQVITKDAFPVQWAMIQNNLGSAFGSLHSGDLEENFWRARDFSEAALQIYTVDDFPYPWSKAQHNLGLIYTLWQDIKDGEEKRQMLTQAIEFFQNALTICTEEAFPYDHEISLRNLRNVERILAELS